MSKALFAAFALAMLLAGCGAESHTPAAAPAAPAAETTSADPAAPLSAEEAEKEKIRKQNAAAEAALSGH
ncbi:hypothetical protein ACFQPC_09050 [Herminiimonas glaciei]|uniref:Lipoprotein n=1 Tax=Herminiimonas glaciei TaxID=523788 RepID=A0ABW2IB74_9BURK